MAFDCFLKIATIDGESTDEKHVNWIEVQSFHHGVSQPTSGAASDAGNRNSGRVDHDNFTVVKTLDKASPKLALACCKGEHIKEVIVELCRAGGDKQKYMEYKLEDVTVQSVSPMASKNGDTSVPLETLTFAYGKITWTYTETDHKTGKAKGNVSSNWDLSANKGG